MSASYIPEETYAVCTYQIGASPQKFIASRNKVSVFRKGKNLKTSIKLKLLKKSKTILRVLHNLKLIE